VPASNPSQHRESDFQPAGNPSRFRPVRKRSNGRFGASTEKHGRPEDPERIFFVSGLDQRRVEQQWRIVRMKRPHIALELPQRRFASFVILCEEGVAVHRNEVVQIHLVDDARIGLKAAEVCEIAFSTRLLMLLLS
jgi:hypothetical protein